jgi:cobyrinic acid a,c-diamide synthase
MIVTNDMQAVMTKIQHSKIDPDYISPNLVAGIAYNMDMNLTSEQIVYISDNY